MTCGRCGSESLKHLFDETRYDKNVGGQMVEVYTWSYWKCNKCRLVFTEMEEEKADG